MAVLNRGAVPEPVLRKQTVDVPALGGEVVLTALMLGQLLALGRKGAGDEDFQHICATLALGVLADDGKPLWSAAQWETWGGSHPAEALDLFRQIDALSGSVNAPDEAAKNA